MKGTSEQQPDEMYLFRDRVPHHHSSQVLVRVARALAHEVHRVLLVPDELRSNSIDIWDFGIRLGTTSVLQGDPSGW